MSLSHTRKCLRPKDGKRKRTATSPGGGRQQLNKKKTNIPDGKSPQDRLALPPESPARSLLSITIFFSVIPVLPVSSVMFSADIVEPFVLLVSPLDERLNSPNEDKNCMPLRDR